MQTNEFPTVIFEAPAGIEAHWLVEPPVEEAPRPPVFRRPVGVACFFHGANQQASWTTEPGKAHYWTELLLRGYICIAFKSAAPAWDMRAEDRDAAYVKASLAAIRDRYGIADLPSVYFGFSSGTGPASVLGFADPTCVGVALFCAPGNASTARLTRRKLPVLIAWHEDDETVKPETIREKIDQVWRVETLADIRESHFRVGHHAVRAKHDTAVFDHLNLDGPQPRAQVIGARAA